MLAGAFVGNSAVVNALFSSCSDGRLPHAVLLTGESGTGKTTLARLLAQACVCTGAQKPCGVCAACVKADSGHPDVHYYRSGNEKTASVGVDEVHEILDDIHLIPGEADCNVMILDDAENLTANAANALLKALEDTPEYSRFILTAANALLLPATVRSRLTEYRLCAVTPQEAADYAVKTAGCSPEDAETAAQCFCGNIGKMLAYLTDEHRRADCLAAAELIKLAAAGDNYGAMRLLDGFAARKRYEAEDAVDLLRATAIQALAARSGGAPPIGLTREELTPIPSEKLLRLCAALEEAQTMLAANCQIAAVFALTASSI